MNTNLMNPIRECSRPRWPFQRRSAAWLPTLTVCLFGFLLPILGQDPRITNTNNPMDTNVSVGATVSFRLFVTSTNFPLTYQWQHAGTNLPAATSFQLVITNVTVAHAGGYRAWITNASGGFTNTRTATLTVDPTFTKIMTGPLVSRLQKIGDVRGVITTMTVTSTCSLRMVGRLAEQITIPCSTIMGTAPSPRLRLVRSAASWEMWGVVACRLGGL